MNHSNLGSVCPKVQKRQSEIYDQAENLERSLVILRDRIEALSDRLHPVLSPVQIAATLPSGALGLGSSSPLGIKLEHMNLAVQSMLTSLSEVLDRVEV